MMQKRSTLSLLLISFMLVFALSVSAQQVTFESKNAARCEANQLLNITVDNLSELGAVEVVFEITGSGGSFFDAVNVNWAPGFTVLTNHIVDMSGVDNVSPDTIRIAAMVIDAGDACLPAGQTVIAQVQFTTNDNCAGTIVLAGGTVSCPSFDISTQFANCGGTAVIPAVVNAGTVTVLNQNPTIAAIADDTVGWGTTHVTNAVGADFDLPNGCESLTYSVVSGPAALTVSPSGTINWTTTGADIGSHVIEIQVADLCGATASTSYTVCVSNEAPVIACPVDTLIALGSAYSSFITATDADGGPAALLYSLVDNAGFAGAAVNAATGEFTWTTLFEESYKGAHTFTVAVTDGGNIDAPCAPRNADTCSFTVTVVNFLVTIEKTHKTIQGQGESVEVYMQNSGFENYPMGGFDFLFQYDASALIFQSATAGQFLTDCGWEYFTYRYGPNGNCGTGCPSGEVRVTAIAETNNGSIHPTCFTNSGSISNQLTVLNFLVTNDRTFECMYAPVRFVWYDCGDNTISDVSGDQLFISNHVYAFEDTNGVYGYDLAAENPFPTLTGANSTCDVGLIDGKPDPLRFIDFVNGGIDIVCADSIDGRGDLNLNDIDNEIADAVLYSNYFIKGQSVFTINLQGQIAASDVNADGIPLSVADLVYLIRIIVGDANPYPKEIVTLNEATFVNAKYQYNNAGIISISDETKIAAAHVVVKGDVEPTLLADNMTMISNFDGINTRILIFSLENNNFTGNMINIGNNEIVSIDMANEVGNQVVAKGTFIPDNYGVAQNYPNPFNPTTTIKFDLPKNDFVRLTIYNVNGQTVKEFSGTFDAGNEGYFEWDASAAASGVYFYRLTAGNFSDVKKMVLLK